MEGGEERDSMNKSDGRRGGINIMWKKKIKRKCESKFVPNQSIAQCTMHPKILAQPDLSPFVLNVWINGWT